MEGGDGVSNGILMEDEILNTPAVTPQQAEAAQPQQNVSAPNGTMPQQSVPQPQQNVAAPNGTMMQQSVPASNGYSSPQQNIATSNETVPQQTVSSQPQQTFSGGAMQPQQSVMSDSSPEGGTYHARNTDRYDGYGAAARRGYFEDPSNIVTGLIGALVGIILGGVAEVLLCQIGKFMLFIVSPFLSAAIVFLAAICYKFLGKSLDQKGAISCALLSMFVVGIFHRISWQYDHIKWYLDNVSRGWTFQLSKLLEYTSVSRLSDLSEMKVYYLCLLLSYFCTTVAAVVLLRKKFADE